MLTPAPKSIPSSIKFSLTGQQLQELAVQKFLPTTGNSGIRNNLALRALAITPDQKFLFMTENALKQDGSSATTSNGSPSRILHNLLTEQPERIYMLLTRSRLLQILPDFSTNGLVELLALDNSGTLLSLERSFPLV